ncbi:hypothetical protein CDL12_18958 [Handroanthus impetiginosus]|uniref:Bet v I/Major latex protein domain-containing protein n=1 Tax=Handroanthus impetiginosus TaxID=429701 RepID=A0A2G9GT45_9LAMI|nr:hypothetical protein CDL12_18958 [Handroanthus impetiginosus]
MASLPCKLMAQIPFKVGGDVFYRLFTNNPQHFSKITPAKIQACDLHDGDYGINGSAVEWKFTVGLCLFGLAYSVPRVLVFCIVDDEEKKQIAYKIIQGDLLELYTNVLVTYHVETKGGVDYVTWTMDYQLLNADNPHPTALVNFVIELIKETEAHIFGQ